MLTRKVTDDDRFINLPSSAQALYLHLSMCADDDGFCNQVTVCMFRAHATTADLQALLNNRFLLEFESGVIVIRHWRLANSLRKDRYSPTVYQEEFEQLGFESAGVYAIDPAGHQAVADGLPDGCQTVTQRVTEGIPKVAQRLPKGCPNISKVKLSKVKLSKDKLSKGGAGGTRTTTPKKKKTSVDLFNELENGRLSPVFETVLKWMQYKDESGKPYKTETGMQSFITQVEKHLHEFGAAAVADCIELSMSNNYQGVVWDRLKKQTASNSDSNPFLRMLQESEANDGTGNIEDPISFEGGIPDVLPGFEGR